MEKKKNIIKNGNHNTENSNSNGVSNNESSTELSNHRRIFDTKELEEGVNMAMKIIKKYYDGKFSDWENHKAFPDFKPGMVISKLSDRVPEKPESMTKILEDVENIILPGMRHWQHPNFYGYFPATISHQAVIADFIKGKVNGSLHKKCFFDNWIYMAC